MQSGIYKIENTLNHKVYIGQSIHIQDRWKEHKREYLKQNVTKKLYVAMQNNGIENFSFEVLEYCPIEKLNEREKYWIKKYDSIQNGYNMKEGGQSLQLDLEKINKIYCFWDSGDSISKIAERLNLNRGTVLKYLSGYKNYSIHNSRIRGGLVTRKKFFVRSKTELKPTINRYTMNGDYIDSWYSCKQIKRELKINNQCVKKALDGEYYSSGGYRWSYIGTPLKEKSDFIRKNNPEKNGMAKLDWTKVHQIKEQLRKGLPKAEIANNFNVSIYTIDDINRGKSWKEENWNYPIYNFQKKKSNN